MYIFTLPIFFHSSNILSLPEALFIATGVFVILWILVPETKDYAGKLTFDNYLFSCWIGSQALWTVFWPFFLMLNVLFLTADLLIKNGYVTVSSWDDLHFVALLPIIWWVVSIWRCSGQTRYRFFSAGARFITISVLLEYALKMYVRTEYPRDFFNCQEQLLDYISCF